jgi:recombination protein RecA
VAKTDKKKRAEAPKSDIKSLLEYCDKQFGNGAVIKGRGAIIDVDSFPTGVITIDKAFGCGGVPLGRIMELFGAESSGKTTTTLKFIASCQKHYFKKKERNGVAAFVDAEHALDPEWAARNGVNMDDLIISQPDSGEEALNIVEAFLKSGLVDLIVVDSVAALVPKAELEGDVGDHHVGAQARMMSQGLRKLKGTASHANATVIFINQIREKVGVVFGNPEVTPGGRALKYYATVRAQVSRASVIKDGDESVGITSKIKMVKNKAAAPFVTGEYNICFGKPQMPVYGIDSVAAMLTAAVEKKIVTKNGSHHKFKGTMLGNGAAKASAFLRENPEIYSEIEQQIYSMVFHCQPSDDENTEKPSRSVDDVLDELDDEE